MRLHLGQVREMCVCVCACVRVCEALPVTAMCLTTPQFLLKKSEGNVLKCQKNKSSSESCVLRFVNHSVFNPDYIRSM